MQKPDIGTQSPYIRVEQESRLVDSLLRFRDHGVDLVDAWLAAIGASNRLDVASFDHNFDKFKDVKRHEPKA